MTHQEFLDMVTPRELYSSGGITATDLLEFALTSYIGKKLLLMGLDEIRKARDEREAREIRDRIERELAVLRAAEGR